MTLRNAESFSRLSWALGIVFTLSVSTGCKIEISVPTGGRVVSDAHVCQAGETCTVDVINTQFDQTFTAIPGSDPIKFAGWQSGWGYFCGGQSAPCRLFTTTFGENEGLLAFLRSDIVFFLSPNFENLSDNFPSGATPVVLEPQLILRGELGTTRAYHDQNMPFGSESDDSDYYVFIAPTHGELTLSLSGLQADLDLSLEHAGMDLIEISEADGNSDERITTPVRAGAIHFVNVFSRGTATSPYTLTLDFRSTNIDRSEVAIAGTYQNASQLAQGQCDNGKFIQKNTAPATLVMEKSGRFTFTEGEQTLSEDSLVYRKYASNESDRTIARQDVYKTFHDNGKLAQVVERNFAGHVRSLNLYLEIAERTTRFRNDGSRESDCILYWPVFADLPEQPPVVTDPMQPILLGPTWMDQIPQNNPALGCPYHPTRGYGYQIDFDWTDASSPIGIMGYRLVAKARFAPAPLIDTFVTASQYTFKVCNGFVDNFDSSTGFDWTVQAQDNQGNFGPISDKGFFITNLCLLRVGTLCYAE